MPSPMALPGLRRAARQTVEALRLGGIARWLRERFHPRIRSAQNADLELLIGLEPQLGRLAGDIRDAARRSRGTALVIAMDSTRYIAQQLPILAGLAGAGLRPVPILASRHNQHVRRLYRAVGVETFAAWDEARLHPDVATLMQDFAACRTQADVLALSWNGLPVGRFAVSTLMRRQRSGHFDMSQPDIRAAIRFELQRTAGHAAAAIALLERWKPRLVVFVDRGYTPEGPLFEACLQRAIDAVTWNVAHRDNSLMLKRYKSGDSDQHPASLSPETWAGLEAMPWTDEHWRELRTELEQCYGSGEWYGEVGTQANARLSQGADIRARLGLDPARKTAVIFPHIFWDATFFWGVDVFADYEDWFRETVRAAIANPAIDWIVKVHPANLVKNLRDGINAEFSELKVLAEFGPLPAHIIVLPADTSIATWSLFGVADYCLTVRGTVGIEAALSGLTVVTAGTGRYDRMGFTVDATTPEQYRDILARLQDIPPPDAGQVERARRYGYGVFLLRPTSLASINFRFSRGTEASLSVTVAHEGVGLDSPDFTALASWFKTSDADFLTRSVP